MAYLIVPLASERRAYAAIRLALVTLLAALAALAPAIAVYADPTIIVNTTNDLDAPGNGLCTLRDAIGNANSHLDLTGGDCASGDGADTITFSITGIISLTVVPATPQTALPPIISDVTISGPGAAKLTVRVLDNNVGVFAVSSSGSLTLQGLTVANGSTAIGAGLANNGGTVSLIDCIFRDNHAFDKGGGIYNSGIVTIVNSTFSGNSADGSGGGIYSEFGTTVSVTGSTFSGNRADTNGGGIHNDGGTIMATDSTFSGNSANGSGGGIHGGLITGGTITIANSTFSGNSASASGGGIFNPNGSRATVTGSMFSGNSADGGGAIFDGESSDFNVTGSTFSSNSANYGGGISSGDGHVTVVDSTFSNNSAVVYGGGMYGGGFNTIINSTFSSNGASSGGGIYNDENLLVTNSTFSGNSATQNGGGIVNGTDSQITVINSTFSGNSATQNGGGMFNSPLSAGAGITNATFAFNSSAIAEGGGAIYNGSALGIRNTILAYSTNNNCAGVDPTNNGHNVRTVGHPFPGDLTCGGILPNGSAPDFCPLFGPLQDNGGSTKTHALLPYINNPLCDPNPTIDMVPVADCPYLIDQRGAPRPQDGNVNLPPVCDIGAFELGPVPPSVVSDAASTAEETQVIIDVLANDSDPNATDILTVTAVTTPISGTATISGTTQVVYTPNLNFNGTDVFTYSMSDGIFTESATVTVTVTPVNDGPPTANDDTVSLAEDTPVHISVLANDSADPDLNEMLSISALTTPAHGMATFGVTQAVYTPTLNFNGTDVFSYTVSDGIFTESAAITVTVTPVNDAPQISDIGNKSVTVGQSTGPLPFTVSDVDVGDLLSVTASSSNPALVPNANIILGGSVGSRTIRVTPAAGNSGAATITVEVSDGHGGTAQDTFILTVTAPESKVYLGFVRR